MKSLPLSTATILALLLVCGCTEDDRLGGNTTQTENTLARILVDSLLPDWNHPSNVPTVATLRFDSSNFDFSVPDSAGSDLSLEESGGKPIPFDIVFWDKPGRLGRIHVRIDTSLLHRHSRFDVRRRLGTPSGRDSAKVWQGLPDSQKLVLRSVLVDDFEDKNDTTLLPTKTVWHTFETDSSEISAKGYLSSGGAVPNTYFSMDFKAENRWYVVLKTALVNGLRARSFRTMDSLVFTAKGTKGTGLFTAMEQRDSIKAWKFDTLDTEWKRICIKPTDFLAPGIGEKSNRGWSVVKDSIRSLTFIVTTGTRFHLDNIRIYGLDRDDLK